MNIGTDYLGIKRDIMLNFRRLLLIALCSFLLTTTVCRANSTVEDTIDARYLLNEQTVMGIVWMRCSGEYRALCYQAYNSALRAVTSAVDNKSEDSKPLAFILDCDETILDNSIYEGALVGTTDSYSIPSFSAWIREVRADAMPGAVELLNKIDKLGVSIFYVSNREADTEAATIENLKRLGFPQADAYHVVFPNNKKDYNKESRQDEIANEYEVIAYMGDSMTDFHLGLRGKSFIEAQKVADDNADEFGTRYIILPNPMYGSWESALQKGYSRMTAEEKNKVRKERLK